MSPDAAIAAMTQRADTIAAARARMSGAMRIIGDMGGRQAVRDVFEAEFERMTVANDNRKWVG